MASMSPTPIAEAQIAEPAVTVDASRPASQLMVTLPALSAEALEATLSSLSQAFSEEDVLLVTPDDVPEPKRWPRLELIHASAEGTASDWILSAKDFSSAADIAGQHNAQVVLLLSGNSSSLAGQSLYQLADCVRAQQTDLALPRFNLSPSSGLVTSAILYPLTRALFAADIRFPLPADAACSARMLKRLGDSSRTLRGGMSSSLLWPVAEAAISGYSVREIQGGEFSPPQPAEGEFNSLFQSILTSLFTDIEAKAPFWQRSRSRSTLSADASTPAPNAAHGTTDGGDEVAEMIDAFHLAQANLQEIWSIVLPPQSRFALKKLALEPVANFAFDPHLWARVVYDFTLAFHLRTLNRGHLLGAMTPLYLAWAASHMLASGNDTDLAARHIETTAACFELEKSYLVSRWRWPDRFNP